MYNYMFPAESIRKILGFWKFSRNGLADDELPLGNSSYFCLFYGFPRGTRLAEGFVPLGDTRQINLVVGFCLHCLAGMNTR